MLWSLFKKEFKYVFSNITYYIFIIIIGVFYFTQFAPPSTTDNFKPLEPKVLQKQLNEGKHVGYGFKKISDTKKEIREVYLKLNTDYNNGYILKEKILINVQVKLNNKEKQFIKEAMEKIAPNEYLEKEDEKLIKVSYDEYLSIVRALDKNLGGGTYYGDKRRNVVLTEPKTYEDALKEYKELISKDGVFNAGGRYFADYLGITAGFFPVFLAAFILIKDKRSKMQEIICSRSISTYSYILSKYLALCLALFIPYLLYATHATFVFYKLCKYNTYAINIFAFYKFSFYWIAPTILFTVALGMLISVIFSNGIAAIPIQFVLWINSLKELEGNYSFSKFIIRFNTFGDYSSYIKWSKSITFNRVFYLITSIGIVYLTAFIWDKKRGTVGEHIK